MRLLLKQFPTFLLLLPASIAASNSSDNSVRTATQLRGGGTTSRIRGASTQSHNNIIHNHNNGNERFLRDKVGKATRVNKDLKEKDDKQEIEFRGGKKMSLPDNAPEGSLAAKDDGKRERKTNNDKMRGKEHREGLKEKKNRPAKLPTSNEDEDKTDKDKTDKDKTDKDKTDKDKTDKDKTGKDKTDKDKTGKDKTDKDKRGGRERDHKKRDRKDAKPDKKRTFPTFPPTKAVVVDPTLPPTETVVTGTTPFETASPTKAPTTAHPTALPTWTWEFIPPKYVPPEPEFVCDYCPMGCYNEDTIVTFPIGGSTTCGQVRRVAPSLTKFQCSVNEQLIRQTCCCPIEMQSASLIGRMDDPVESSACSFCNGGTMKTDFTTTINFSDGKDSVSCGGLSVLISSGLPGSFCLQEKEAIEATCCETNDNTTPVDGRVESPDSVSISEDEAADEPADEPAEEVSESADGNEDRGCSFCDVGEEYLEDPIILFSSGNDSVSCAGLLQIIRSGLSSNFCNFERINIEEACCRLTQEPSSSPTGAPTASPSESPSESPTTSETPTASPTEEPTVSAEPTTTSEPTDVLLEDAKTEELAEGQIEASEPTSSPIGFPVAVSLLPPTDEAIEDEAQTEELAEGQIEASEPTPKPTGFPVAVSLLPPTDAPMIDEAQTEELADGQIEDGIIFDGDVDLDLEDDFFDANNITQPEEEEASPSISPAPTETYPPTITWNPTFSPTTPAPTETHPPTITWHPTVLPSAEPSSIAVEDAEIIEEAETMPEEESNSSSNTTPSTIKDGGKRDSIPLGNVNRQRKPTTTRVEPETASAEGNKGSSPIQRMGHTSSQEKTARESDRIRHIQHQPREN